MSNSYLELFIIHPWVLCQTYILFSITLRFGNIALPKGRYNPANKVLSLLIAESITSLQHRT